MSTITLPTDQGAHLLAISWQWEFALRVLPDLLEALWVTVRVTIFASVLAVTAGWVWLALRKTPFLPVRAASWLMLEFIRDTPPLVHLFMAFYVFPIYGVTWSPFVVGVVVLGVHYSSFASEVYRGSLAAIPSGHFEAARVLGLSKLRTWWSVVIPQVLRESLPALGNVVLALMKETALLVAISVPVLMTVAQRAGSRSFRYLEPLTVAALLYLLFTIPFGLFVRRMEKRHAH